MQQQLSIGYVDLRELALRFRECSTDLRINTYYETEDTELRFIAANDNILRSYRVPIASVSSAIMDLEDEAETPLSSDHVGCATFEKEEAARYSFISNLEDAVRVAIELSNKTDYILDLEDEVKVEVSGFFEDSTSSVKVWTARPSLAVFFKRGPWECLRDRLREPQGAPEPSASKKDMPKVEKLGNPAFAQAGDEPKNKLQEIVQNKLRTMISGNKQGNQPRPNVVTSASDSQLATHWDTVKRGDASIPEPISESTSKVPFTPPNRPNPSTKRRSTVTTADPRPHTPSIEPLKLVWVHVPFTHTGWVPEVLKQCSKRNKFDSHSDFLKEEHWASKHNRGRHSAPHARYVNSAFVNPSREIGSQAGRNDSRFATYVSLLSPQLDQ